jgi:hypothetical protein
MRVARSPWSALGAGTLVLLAGGCASPVPPTGAPTPTVDVSNWVTSTLHLADGSEEGFDLSFAHPSNWTVLRPEGQVGEPHSVVVLYLSNQPMHSTCHREGTLKVLGCGGEPLESLGPGGVFVDWWIGRGMGWNWPRKFDSRLTIGGRMAVIVLGGSCDPITGVEHSMQVFVQRDFSSGDVLDACFRGPATDQAQAQFLTMVESMF